MRKERDIIVKVIKKENVSTRRLAKFFADKYKEKCKDTLKEKA